MIQLSCATTKVECDASWSYTATMEVNCDAPWFYNNGTRQLSGCVITAHSTITERLTSHY